MIRRNKTRKERTHTLRCTKHAHQEIQEMAARLFLKHMAVHKAIGLNKPSSRVAVDALLYFGAMNGEVDGNAINEENNLYCLIKTLEEEGIHE